jgi:hypothetical protein
MDAAAMRFEPARRGSGREIRGHGSGLAAQRRQAFRKRDGPVAAPVHDWLRLCVYAYVSEGSCVRVMLV